MNFTATATISLAALRHNLARIRERLPGGNVMAMVKANAYGHGLVGIARALDGADSLAVARVEEARALRDDGIAQPVVLLEGVFDAAGMQDAAALDCELVVHTPEQLELLADEAGPARFVVWLKIDSGMNRLGFPPAQAEAVITRLRAMPAVAELRLMTHYASADLLSDESARRQSAIMTPLVDRFDGAISLANSPALLREDSDDFTGQQTVEANRIWLRPGIALYGISPFSGVSAAALDLRPVMNFETRLIAVRDLSAGDQVGYGGRYIAERPMRLGIAAAGYGDGYPRLLPDGTPLLVDGLRCSLAGRVSMDMLSVDLTQAPEARVGSSVRLWGDGLPAEAVAENLGTIAYELVTRVSERVTREYR